ncbi:hypothetical protein GP475_09685 [Corynebacterium poyangense]|uniref:Phage tail protein n=1 Tax=Corynebacterium poyangense TaxID=2684405 RepID=A0A7H0SQQ5_9CORY|nr:hypothetical protein [Corynebacterium poyangense]QNQ90880.1 hypothetical protein GP475_09685 [Corynebacterium poyangense]
MPAKYYSLGPGTLKLGETGTGLDLSCQVKSAKVTWDNDKDDDIYTLCGDTVPGETTYSAKLELTALQDLSTGGIIEYTWKNKGTKVKVVYVPNTAQGAKVEGEVIIQPCDVGGDVRSKPETDLELPFVGEPSFTPQSAG